MGPPLHNLLYLTENLFLFGPSKYYLEQIVMPLHIQLESDTKSNKKFNYKK